TTSGLALFKSTDGGVQWTNYAFIPASGSVGSIAFDNQSRMFARATRSGIYRSTDLGSSWAEVGPTISSPLILKIKNDNTVFVGSDSALYRSTNNGDSWTTINLEGVPVQTTRIYFDVNNDVYVSPGPNSPTYYVSTNNGDTWSKLTAAHNKAKVLLRDKSGNLFAASNGTVARSTDNGATWEEKAIGMNALSVYGEATSGSTMYAATSKGVLKSQDDGTSWTMTGATTPIPANGIVKGSDGTLFAWSGSSIYTSSDNGSSWILRNTFLSTISAATAAPWGPVFVGLNIYYESVYASTNSGGSWNLVKNNPASQNNSISALASEAPNYVYAWTRFSTPGAVSTDGGSSWNNLSPVPSFSIVYSSMIGPNGKLYAAGGNAISVSTDHGSSWTALPKSGINPVGGQSAGVCEVLVDGSSKVFLGTRFYEFDNLGSGVYRLDPGQQVFSNITQGIAPGSKPDILSLFLSPGNHLFAGTNGEGLARTQATTDVEDKVEVIPESYSLYQNYPNPFNPSTTLKYQLPARSDVSLDVYNLLGQRVTTLVHQLQEPGFYTLNFDASSLPTGMYLARLTAGNFVKVQKMLLLK
ncbi:MAG: hypothetical protein HW389_3095, partial [Bacteroidetes bacterium]|nr:hypothetical protein [Bacteroidota bacterium]